MSLRHRLRISLRCPVVIGTDTCVAEGYLINLSVAGCAIEMAHPSTDKYVRLHVLLPEKDEAFRIALARVRWITETCCGVEFLVLSGETQRGIRHLISDYVMPPQSSLHSPSVVRRGMYEPN